MESLNRRGVLVSIFFLQRLQCALLVVASSILKFLCVGGGGVGSDCSASCRTPGLLDVLALVRAADWHELEDELEDELVPVLYGCVGGSDELEDELGRSLAGAPPGGELTIA